MVGQTPVEGWACRTNPRPQLERGQGDVIARVPLALGSGYEVDRGLARGYYRERLLWFTGKDL